MVKIWCTLAHDWLFAFGFLFGASSLCFPSNTTAKQGDKWDRLHRSRIDRGGHVASLSEQRAGIGLMLSQASASWGCVVFFIERFTRRFAQVFGNPGSSGSAVFRFSPERQRYEAAVPGLT